MPTQYFTATSLDGFIADADHSLDWLFELERDGRDGSTDDDQDNEWAADRRDEYPRFIAQVGALAMGSTTYEWILAHERLLDDPSRWPYEQPAWVFSSRTLPVVPGADIRFVRGDVAPVHAAMVEAAAGANVWLVGGGELVGQFHDRGLLDEIILGVASVTLGSGAPLLPRAITAPTLRLLEARRTGPAFVTLRYAVSHPPA